MIVRVLSAFQRSICYNFFIFYAYYKRLTKQDFSKYLLTGDFLFLMQIFLKQESDIALGKKELDKELYYEER